MVIANDLRLANASYDNVDRKFGSLSGQQTTSSFPVYKLTSLFIFSKPPFYDICVVSNTFNKH